MFDRLYQENWLEQVGNDDDDDDEKRSIELEYSLASLGIRALDVVASVLVRARAG